MSAEGPGAAQAPRAGRIRRSRAATAWRRLKGAPAAAWFGLVVILICGLVAVFAPLIAPYGESQIVSSQPYGPWNAQFPLGTDQLGRDILSRMIFGARNSVGIAVVTTSIAFMLGGGLGILSATVGGWIDQALSRAMDTLMAVPQLIFALVLLVMLGSSIPNIILIIALLDSTRVFRLARSAAMNVAVMDFVEAARLRGEGSAAIVVREILPNILPSLAAEFGLRFCFVFLTISALSFLGLGIQPPAADWGTMVREGAAFISYGDITPLIPAGAVALLTVAVNLVVDWLLEKVSGIRDAQ